MLTLITAPGYSYLAAAKSVAGIDSPNLQRRTSAPNDGAFFASPLWVAVRGSLRAAGFLCSRSVNPRTVAHPSIDSEPGDSKYKGVLPMAQLRLNNLITRSLESRASAHRAMAKSALFADSSARTRLKRYNHHIEKAEVLEARALETAKRSAGGVA